MVVCTKITSKATIFCILLLIVGCSNEIVRISALDGSNKLTILTEGDIRYIIDGDSELIPDEGFIKLDVSGIDELADAIYICWPTDSVTGEIVIPRAKVLIDKLDPERFVFRAALPVDDRGIPTEAMFITTGCISVDFLLKREHPPHGAIVN